MQLLSKYGPVRGLALAVRVIGLASTIFSVTAALLIFLQFKSPSPAGGALGTGLAFLFEVIGSAVVINILGWVLIGLSTALISKGKQVGVGTGIGKRGLVFGILMVSSIVAVPVIVFGVSYIATHFI